MRLKTLLFVSMLWAAFAVQAEWSQNAASDVVTELLDGVNELVALSGEGGGQSDAVRNKFSHGALVDLRILVDELDRLSVALSAGKNKAQTFAQYRKISNLRDSIRDYVQDVEIPETIKAKAETAGELLRTLDVMYAE